MKKNAFAALIVLLGLLVLTAFAANEPMWVDGNGNVIDNPNTGSSDTAGTTGTTGGTTTDSYGDVVYSPVPDGWGESTPDPNAPQRWEYTATVLTAQWKGEKVTILALGTVVSTIKTSEGKVEVYTRELTFDTLAPEGQQLAIINVPKSGQSSMHKKPNAKSSIIMKCQTGTVVVVWEVKKSWVKVHYADADGWIPRSSVKFVSVSQEVGSFAYVSYKGNPRSGTTVNIRQKADSGSRQLSEFPCGQRVTVFGTDGGWTEIEAQSIHGYIRSDFLTVLTEEEAADLPVRGIGSRIHAVANLTPVTPAPEMNYSNVKPLQPTPAPQADGEEEEGEAPVEE